MTRERTERLSAEEAALARELASLPDGGLTPALDARILAQAHAAVKRRSLRPWGVALAAVLALGVGLRMTLAPVQMPLETGEWPSDPATDPAVAERSAAPQPASVDSDVAGAAAGQGDAVDAVAETDRAEAAPAGSRPAPATPAVPAAVGETADDRVARTRPTAPESAAADRPAPASRPAQPPAAELQAQPALAPTPAPPAAPEKRAVPFPSVATPAPAAAEPAPAAAGGPTRSEAGSTRRAFPDPAIDDAATQEVRDERSLQSSPAEVTGSRIRSRQAGQDHRDAEAAAAAAPKAAGRAGLTPNIPPAEPPPSPPPAARAPMATSVKPQSFRESGRLATPGDRPLGTLIEEARRLHSIGDLDAWQRVLRQIARDHPDADLPEDIRDWLAELPPIR